MIQIQLVVNLTVGSGAVQLGIVSERLIYSDHRCPPYLREFNYALVVSTGCGIDGLRLILTDLDTG
jgi:hypothetical protein